MRAALFASLQPVRPGPYSALAAWPKAGEVDDSSAMHWDGPGGWLVPWDRGAAPADGRS